MTNCVNCGSAKDVSATVCPFCGTSYFDLTDIDLSDNRKPSIVRFKYGGAVFQMKAMVGLASFEMKPRFNDVMTLSDYMHTYTSVDNELSANIEFISCG